MRRWYRNLSEFVQALDAAIEEHDLVVKSGIERGRCVAGYRGAARGMQAAGSDDIRIHGADADRQRQRIAAGQYRMMAGRAGHILVAAERPGEEQFHAELRPGIGDRRQCPVRGWVAGQPEHDADAAHAQRRGIILVERAGAEHKRNKKGGDDSIWMQGTLYPAVQLGHVYPSMFVPVVVGVATRHRDQLLFFVSLRIPARVKSS